MTTTAASSSCDDGESSPTMSPTEKMPMMSVREHTSSTIALCMCSLVNAFLQISVFPYAGYMVIHMDSRITQDNVGTRAGAIASSFMVGRSLSAYGWGNAADVYGRTFVLQSCLLLSSIFSILFGTSQTFGQAMLWRFCLGMSNGIIGAAKTAATELAHGDRTLERRTMGLVMGMRSWGYLIGPALGGLLAEPLRQYPNASWLQQDGWLHSVLSKFPYMLPNLLAAAGCILTAVVLQNSLHETLSEARRRDFAHAPIDAAICLYGSVQRTFHAFYSVMVRGQQEDSESRRFLGSSSEGNVELVSARIGQDDSPVDSPPTTCHDSNSETPSARTLWSRPSTRRFMIAHWSFAFVSMMIDEAFPLFCMSQTGGLALTEASIGTILSGAGIFFAVLQYAVFATLVSRFGEYWSMMIGSIVGLQPSALIPLSLLINRAMKDGVSWGTISLLSFLMGTCKLFGCLYFTSLALSLNTTVPDAQRATMNGLVVVGASIVRAIAPAFAGSIASFAFSSKFFPSRYGSLLLYLSISFLGGLVCIRIWKLREHHGVVTAKCMIDEGREECIRYNQESRANADTRHEHTV